MIHIHRFKKVGDWKGSWGIKMCRCGMHRLYDLWGFQQEVNEDATYDSIMDNGDSYPEIKITEES